MYWRKLMSFLPPGYNLNRSTPEDRPVPRSPAPDVELTDAQRAAIAGGVFQDVASGLDNVEKNLYKRTGNFDSITDGIPLIYPSDMFEAKSGVVNWLQFRIFFKQNAALSGVISKVANTASSLIEDLGGTLTEIGSDASQIISNQTAFLRQNNNDASADAEEIVTNDTRLAAAKEQTSDSINLYVPGGLEYSDGLLYNEVELATAKNLLSGLSSAGSIVAYNAIKKRIAGAADAAGEFLGVENLNTEAAISSTLGVVANPRKEQVFDGVNLRTFTFSFVFVPRNKKEADTVAAIIRTFRFHAYPELSRNNAFFNFPSEFEITYKSYDTTGPDQVVVDNPVLPKIGRCVLETVTHNYTPDDVYVSFRDGMAPKITMSLSFKETEVISRQHIFKGF